MAMTHDQALQKYVAAAWAATGMDASAKDAWFGMMAGNLSRNFEQLWATSPENPANISTPTPPAGNSELDRAIQRIMNGEHVDRDTAIRILNREQPRPSDNAYVPNPQTGWPVTKIDTALERDKFEEQRRQAEQDEAIRREQLAEEKRQADARLAYETGMATGKINGINTMDSVKYSNSVLSDPQNAALSEQIRGGFALGDKPGQTVADYLNRSVDNPVSTIARPSVNTSTLPTALHGNTFEFTSVPGRVGGGVIPGFEGGGDLASALRALAAAGLDSPEKVRQNATYQKVYGDVPTNTLEGNRLGETDAGRWWNTIPAQENLHKFFVPRHTSTPISAPTTEGTSADTSSISTSVPDASSNTSTTNDVATMPIGAEPIKPNQLDFPNASAWADATYQYYKDKAEWEDKTRKKQEALRSIQEQIAKALKEKLERMNEEEALNFAKTHPDDPGVKIWLANRQGQLDMGRVPGEATGGQVTVGGQPHWIVDNQGNPQAALTEDGKKETIKGKGSVEVIPLDPARRAAYEAKKAAMGDRKPVAGMAYGNENWRTTGEKTLPTPGSRGRNGRRTAPSRRPGAAGGNSTRNISGSQVKLPDNTIASTTSGVEDARAGNGQNQGYKTSDTLTDLLKQTENRSPSSREARGTRPAIDTNLNDMAAKVQQRIENNGPQPVKVTPGAGYMAGIKPKPAVQPTPGAVATPIPTAGWMPKFPDRSLPVSPWRGIPPRLGEMPKFPDRSLPVRPLPGGGIPYIDPREGKDPYGPGGFFDPNPPRLGEMPKFPDWSLPVKPWTGGTPDDLTRPHTNLTTPTAGYPAKTVTPRMTGGPVEIPGHANGTPGAFYGFDTADAAMAASRAAQDNPSGWGDVVKSVGGNWNPPSIGVSGRGGNIWNGQSTPQDPNGSGGDPRHLTSQGTFNQNAGVVPMGNSSYIRDGQGRLTAVANPDNTFSNMYSQVVNGRTVTQPLTPELRAQLAGELGTRYTQHLFDRMSPSGDAQTNAGKQRFSEAMAKYGMSWKNQPHSGTKEWLVHGSTGDFLSYNDKMPVSPFGGAEATGRSVYWDDKGVAHYVYPSTTPGHPDWTETDQSLFASGQAPYDRSQLNPIWEGVRVGNGRGPQGANAPGWSVGIDDPATAAAREAYLAGTATTVSGSAYGDIIGLSKPPTFIGSGGARTIGNNVAAPRFGFASNAPTYIAGQNQRMGVKNTPGVFVNAAWKWSPRVLKNMNTPDRQMLESYVRATGNNTAAFYDQAKYAEPIAPNEYRSFVG